MRDSLSLAHLRNWYVSLLLDTVISSPGGGTAIYGLYRYVPAVKGMVFKQFTLG